MSSLSNQKGVLHGDAVQELFEIAKKNQFALPAVNVTGTDTVNAVLEPNWANFTLSTKAVNDDVNAVIAAPALITLGPLNV